MELYDQNDIMGMMLINNGWESEHKPCAKNSNLIHSRLKYNR